MGLAQVINYKMIVNRLKRAWLECPQLKCKVGFGSESAKQLIFFLLSLLHLSTLSLHQATEHRVTESGGASNFSAEVILKVSI